MARYQIWNKTDDIYTPSGAHFTAAEWAAQYPWVNIPGSKMIITTGIINGGTAMEFVATANHYQRMGAEIDLDTMTDDEVLEAIEAFEDTPPDPGPSVEERTAAALEFLAMNSLPDEA